MWNNCMFCHGGVSFWHTTNSLRTVSVTLFFRVYFHLNETTSFPPGASFDV